MPKLMVTINSKETEVETDDFTEEQKNAHEEVLHVQREIDRNNYINELLERRKVVLLEKLVSSDKEKT
tara:strand:- start:99 stop:302 length:204 start_codon:yes stop_codon:yes gene_type:complete